MSGYIGNIPVPQATQTRNVFTATSGQTSFATSGYTPGFLDVWLNGVKLVNGTDFTATNGSDVVLSSGAATSDTVEVLSYSTYEVNAQTYTGGLTAKNDGAAAITANRLTSDGTILDLKKDGTTVGSIGTAGSSTYVAGASSGLRFAGLNILPSNASGSYTDNTSNLGGDTERFKNLYLSGGVYLGGTGGENLLDDYEEGTWEITLTSSGGSITAGANNTGGYTKVGRLVSVSGRIDVLSVSSPTGRLDVSLPFTNSVGPEEAFRTAVNVTFYKPTSSQAAINFEGRMSSGANFFTVYLGTPTNGVPNDAAAYVQANSEIWFNCTYHANS